MQPKEARTRARAAFAALAVLGMAFAGAAGAVGQSQILIDTPLEASDAAAGTRGAVLDSARGSDPFSASYTLREAREPEIGDVHGQVIAGRGASFAFQAFNTTLPVYNAEQGGDNLAGYGSCGSSCGRRSILATAKPTEGFFSCADDRRMVPNAVWQSAAECAAAEPQAEARWTIFGGTDQPLTKGDYARAAALGAEALHIPLAVGVVTVAYNLAPFCDTGLELTPLEIARMLRPVSGQSGEPGITHWDSDADMVARNPCLQSVGHVPVQSVIRCDGSGTTFAFSDFLARYPGVGSPWVANDLIDDVVQNEYCGPQNAGVSSCIMGRANTVNCPTPSPGDAFGRFGYVELAQSLVDDLDVASVRNRDDTAFVAPTPETGAAAANGAALPAAHEVWTDVTIVDSSGIDAYPAATFTYLIAFANPWDIVRPAGESIPGPLNYIDREGDGDGWYTCDQFGALRQMTAWLVTTGQENLPLGYSPIGDRTAGIALAGVARMACGPEGPQAIDDVHQQGFPAAGQRVALKAAGSACPAALPIPACSEDVVFQPIAGLRTTSAAGIDVLADAHVGPLDIGPNLNGKWVAVRGAVTALPPGGACTSGVPVCQLVLVDNVPVGYVSGALAPHVRAPAAAGLVYGQVIDNQLVVHGFA